MTIYASLGLEARPVDFLQVQARMGHGYGRVKANRSIRFSGPRCLLDFCDYSGSGLHGIGCSDSRCRGLALREARHDGTVVAGFARADRARGWGGEFSSRRGGAVRGEPVGGDQADAAGAPDRQHGSGEDRGPAPADPGAACRHIAGDRNEQARDHAQGDAGSPAGPRHRREGAVHHRRHAASAGAVAQKRA